MEQEFVNEVLEAINSFNKKINNLKESLDHMNKALQLTCEHKMLKFVCKTDEEFVNKCEDCGKIICFPLRRTKE